MTLKLQVKIDLSLHLKLAADGDKTKLFESEFQWLLMRLTKKLPSRTDVIWGLKSFIELHLVVLR